MTVRDLRKQLSGIPGNVEIGFRLSDYSGNAKLTSSRLNPPNIEIPNRRRVRKPERITFAFWQSGKVTK